ncbi:RING-H2 finger protein ATL66 [Cucumis melo var. makuwa]|uniref:RING-H2 finger protein ATL66 n=1 Tax=Cucumis melo var. makuwa TaxID=1194695 RepID=A0A5D3DE65_CUCMM|nr:RING-H2 finger protein ATL66 [Cucumis melo var. makuwa]
MVSSSRAPKHTWTKEEEAKLVECLVELISAGGWRFDNGTFRSGVILQSKTFYTNHFHIMMICPMSSTKIKDRVTEARSETFADIGSNVTNMFNDDVPLGDSHDQDIPMMYSQGVHMSPDEIFGIRAGQASERKKCSSGSKRKRGSEHYETVEMIKSALEFGNDQLKAIAN